MVQYSFLLESNEYMQESLLGDLWEKGKHNLHKVKNAIKKGYRTGSDFAEMGPDNEPGKVMSRVSQVAIPAIVARRKGLKAGLATALAQQVGKHASRAVFGMKTRSQMARSLKNERRERDKASKKDKKD